MFITEQHIAPKKRLKPKTGYFTVGTQLAKVKTVNRRITYKEVTLVLGIFVALIIFFTVWTSRNVNLIGDISPPSVGVATLVDAITKTATAIWW